MKTNPLTLTLYPNGFGMGYLISETPKEIINYGVARIRPLTTSNYIKRLYRFITYYRPKLVILRNYHKDSRVSKRIQKIIDRFEKQATESGLLVFKYSRDDIKEVFKQFEGSSKYVISKTIASWYPELNYLLPDIRKYPNPEHYQMGVFDAFALMVTHHYIH